MISIEYEGWAQCRLATDPDPYDEIRGVSGYMKAYAGEPDLDRVIRFNSPLFERTLTQKIEVKVKKVIVDGVVSDQHPLNNCLVDLLEKPVFEGRNGVIAEDGLEPIIPFHIRFSSGENSFSRKTVPTDPDSPYREFNASGVKVDLQLIQRKTGIHSILDIWNDRLLALRDTLTRTAQDSTDRPALEERIAFLERNLAVGGGAGRFFAALMEWDYELKSEVFEQGGGLTALLPEILEERHDNLVWRTSFWFGGWDADASAYFVSGSLNISSPNAKALRRPERDNDIELI